MKEVLVKIKQYGSCGIIMNNPRTASKIDSFALWLSRNKLKDPSEEQYLLYHLYSWYAKLYTNKRIEVGNPRDGGPESPVIIPDDCKVIITARTLQSCFISGAKKGKLGKQYSSGVMVSDNAILNHKYDKIGIGRELFDYCNKFDFYSNKSGASTMKVEKYHPLFDDWHAEVSLLIDEEQIGMDDVMGSIKSAGCVSGLGDWRPAKYGMYGKFEVESYKEITNGK